MAHYFDYYFFLFLFFYSCFSFSFSPLFPSTLHPSPTSIPPLSSCPWVEHIRSLASLFPILFLISHCLFCTYHLCFFFPVPFPPFFPHFYPSPPCTTLPASILHPCFMSLGYTYKFFGFSVSYTILNLPLSILFLPFMFLIPCTFSPISHLPLPADNPLISLFLWFCSYSSCFLSLFLFLFLGQML